MPFISPLPHLNIINAMTHLGGKALPLPESLSYLDFCQGAWRNCRCNI